MASWTAGVCTAVFHIGCSSRGGPGRTTTVGAPGTTTPGAVPTGSITTAPTGTMACLRFAARTASKSPVPMRDISFFKISAILFSSTSSSSSSRPQNWATMATVMSSAVGPRPPLVITRSTPSLAMKRSAASMSAARSPQMAMWASSTPSSSSRSASHGPLRSATRPVRTSVPVMTMPARALTVTTLGGWRQVPFDRLDLAGHRVGDAGSPVRLDDHADSRASGGNHFDRPLDDGHHLAPAVTLDDGEHRVGLVRQPRFADNANGLGDDLTDALPDSERRYRECDQH